MIVKQKHLLSLSILILCCFTNYSCKYKGSDITTSGDDNTVEYKVTQYSTSSLPESVIKMDVASQNNHDWQSYLAIRTAKPGPPENRNDLMILKEKCPQNIMIKNIERAQLVGIKPLSSNFVEGLTRIDKYLNLYGEIRTFYVGIDYKLKQEKRHIYNGVNYRLYILGQEEGNWVIVEASEVPVHRMIEGGYGFGTPEEKTALRIQEERQRTGKFINAKGEIIPD